MGMEMGAVTLVAGVWGVIMRTECISIINQ